MIEKFKVWLEGDNEAKRYFDKYDRDVPLSYYNREGWRVPGLGDDHTAYIQKHKKIISIDKMSPYHPKAKEIIKELLDELPEIKDYKLNFDGDEVGTVSDYLAKEWEYPEFWYHGTSTWHYESIKENGLQSRRQSDIKPSYYTTTAKQGHENLIYLAADDGNDVRFAARAAARIANKNEHKADPIILKIDAEGLNPNKMKPDEDSEKWNWKESLYSTGTIAYEGIIQPKWISIHKLI